MEEPKDYKWIAYYNDGTSIEEGDGVKFTELEQDKLVSFEIIDGDEVFGVDLVTGVFNCNNENAVFEGFSNLGEDYRLIYFKRNTIVFNPPNTIHTRVPFIGYQFNDSDGNNQKIMMSKKDNNYQVHIK